MFRARSGPTCLMPETWSSKKDVGHEPALGQAEDGQEGQFAIDRCGVGLQGRFQFHAVGVAGVRGDFQRHAAHEHDGPDVIAGGDEQIKHAAADAHALVFARHPILDGEVGHDGRADGIVELRAGDFLRQGTGDAEHALIGDVALGGVILGQPLAVGVGGVVNDEQVRGEVVRGREGAKGIGKEARIGRDHFRRHIRGPGLRVERKAGAGLAGRG